MLTTHSMEEAEVLCTRIGIMADGELKCLGTQQHLKSKYGEGFKVDVMYQSGEKDKADAFITSTIPEARLSMANEGYLSYQVDYLCMNQCRGHFRAFHDLYLRRPDRSSCHKCSQRLNRRSGGMASSRGGSLRPTSSRSSSPLCAMLRVRAAMPMTMVLPVVAARVITYEIYPESCSRMTLSPSFKTLRNLLCAR